jgi:hypothetical protein
MQGVTMRTLLVLALGVPSVASAKSNQVLPYPPSDVWPATIRYLRIDRGATLREKDAESGYVLFDLPDDKKTYKGTLELVRTNDGQGDEAREATRVIVSLPELPRHYELSLLEKLAAKIKDEYGSPPALPARRPEAPKKPSDGGVLPRPERGELPRPERR